MSVEVRKVAVHGSSIKVTVHIPEALYRKLRQRDKLDDLEQLALDLPSVEEAEYLLGISVTAGGAEWPLKLIPPLERVESLNIGQRTKLLCEQLDRIIKILLY